jgi:membrane-bound ClpP family serine protease
VNLAVLVPVVVLLSAGLFALAIVTARALDAPPQSGLEALVGTRAVVRDAVVSTPEGHVGMVFAEGARWRAVCSEPVPEGSEVEIVAVHFHPARLEVKAVRKGES